MTLTLENLKADEITLIEQIQQTQGALAYNRQLQAHLAKEAEIVAMGDGGEPLPPQFTVVPDLPKTAPA